MLPPPWPFQVVLGLPYNGAIDMWSLGCVGAELFLGLPIFPGASEFNLVQRIIETLGAPSQALLLKASNTNKYFRREPLPAAGYGAGGAGAGAGPDSAAPGAGAGSSGAAGGAGSSSAAGGEPSFAFVLRTEAEMEAETGKRPATGKRYFKHTKLADLIFSAAYRRGLSDSELERENEARAAFLDWLLGVLEVDPQMRWTPAQASTHPFITGQPFHGPFQPPPREDAPAPPAGASAAAALSLPDFAQPRPVGSPGQVQAPRATPLRTGWQPPVGPTGSTAAGAPPGSAGPGAGPGAGMGGLSALQQRGTLPRSSGGLAIATSSAQGGAMQPALCPGEPPHLAARPPGSSAGLPRPQQQGERALLSPAAARPQGVQQRRASASLSLGLGASTAGLSPPTAVGWPGHGYGRHPMGAGAHAGHSAAFAAPGFAGSPMSAPLHLGWAPGSGGGSAAWEGPAPQQGSAAGGGAGCGWPRQDLRSGGIPSGMMQRRQSGGMRAMDGVEREGSHSQSVSSSPLAAVTDWDPARCDDDNGESGRSAAQSAATVALMAQAHAQAHVMAQAHVYAAAAAQAQAQAQAVAAAVQGRQYGGQQLYGYSGGMAAPNGPGAMYASPGAAPFLVGSPGGFAVLGSSPGAAPFLVGSPGGFAVLGSSPPVMMAAYRGAGSGGGQQGYHH